MSFDFIWQKLIHMIHLSNALKLQLVYWPNEKNLSMGTQLPGIYTT